MTEERTVDMRQELHAVVFELAQVAAVVDGCGRLLTTRETNPDPAVGAILARAVTDLVGVRDRVRKLLD